MSAASPVEDTLDTSWGRPVVHFHKGKIFKFSFSPDPAADGKVLGFHRELYHIFNKRKEHGSIILIGGIGIKSIGCLMETGTLKSASPTTYRDTGEVGIGVSMSTRKGISQEIPSPHQKVKRKDKNATLKKFTKTTGYNRTYAIRL
jgi:hypothetical protein